MEFISKGGYAEVFYDTHHKDIFRRMSCIDKSTRELDFTSFNDLIFTKSFEYTNYTPVIYNETISKKQVSFHMPHYGITLYRWVKQNTLETRQKYAPYIILQIILACLHFEKNAFFHSDLKPCNIMIETIYEDHSDENENVEEKNVEEEDAETEEKEMAEPIIKDIIVRIIDFNSSSIRIVSKRNPYVCWANAIGTWNYAAPEIILYEMPYDNSISWTIGTIAAFIIDAYPFIDLITTEMDRSLAEQYVWIKTIEKWYIKYSIQPPLTRKEWYDDRWRRIICGCIQWSSVQRYSLEYLYKTIYADFINNTKLDIPLNRIISPTDLSNIQTIRYVIEGNRIPNTDRDKIVLLLYSICEQVSNMNLFPTAMAIFDRSLRMINDIILQYINYLAAGAFLLSCFVHNINVLLSKIHIDLMLNTFTCTHKSYIVLYMHHIGDILGWKLWEKPVHILIAEKDEKMRIHPDLFKYIRDAFLRPCDKYTQEELADYILENFKNHDGNNGNDGSNGNNSSNKKDNIRQKRLSSSI